MNTPVSSILSITEPRLNSAIQGSASARNACAALDQKSLAVRFDGLNLRILCRCANGGIKLDKDGETAADAEISGGPFSMARLLTEDPQDLLRAGLIRIDGNTEIADDFQTLFGFIRPDIEEVLSQYLGDSVARQASLLTAEFGSWLQDIKVSIGRSTGDYLQEESKDLPSPTEVEEFNNDVDQLVQAVDRAAARLDKIRNASHRPAST